MQQGTINQEEYRGDFLHGKDRNVEVSYASECPILPDVGQDLQGSVSFIGIGFAVRRFMVLIGDQVKDPKEESGRYK